MHTGQWPHEDVDFTGKRVGQIGTGSTGIQAAPVIAETARHLTVFQRTANYSVPARNAPLTPEFRQYLRENYADIVRIMRKTPNGHPFVIERRLVADVTSAERQAIYEAAWDKGGLQFRATFHDLLLDKAANDTAAEFIKSKIRRIVKDKATAEKLADIDHPYAAKRPADRHRLFRGLQPRQRRPGRRARGSRSRPSRPAAYARAAARTIPSTSLSSPPASMP